MLFVGGPRAQALSTNSTYFRSAISVTGLTIAVVLNVVGLNVGKWLSNVGAIAGWIPIALLIPFGVYSLAKHGSATPITPPLAAAGHGPERPHLFYRRSRTQYAGVEAGSTMGEEIVDARRTVPRAIVAAGLLIAAIYIVATLCLLLALPSAQIAGLQGLMQAVQAIAAKANVAWFVPIVAVFITLNALGGVAGWFAATARIPFVAGLDHFLPAAFGKLHPRWKTPYVALLVQAVFAAVFIVLGQAGTNVRGAYDALVSMGIIGQFIPYLFMFGAMAVLQREPAGPGVIRTPGGAPVARALAAVGFLVSVAAIVLACVPADDEVHKTLAVIKIVGASVALLAIGAAIYFIGDTETPVMTHLLLAAALLTMRVDYYHTGTATQEHFSLDRVVVEPRCRGPAIRRKPSTPLARGSLISSRSSTKRRRKSYICAASRRWSWSGETTAEAMKISRTFSESMRFPGVDKPARIVLKKRDAKNVFQDVWETRVDPADKFIVRAGSLAAAGPLIKLHERGDPATKLDLLILGDGYTAAGARKVDARRQAAACDIVRDVTIQGTRERHQCVGPRAGVYRLGYFAAVESHLQAHASWHDVRHVRFGAVRADAGESRVSRSRCECPV